MLRPVSLMESLIRMQTAHHKKKLNQTVQVDKTIQINAPLIVESYSLALLDHNSF